jgi:hypothetical protein
MTSHLNPGHFLNLRLTLRERTAFRPAGNDSYATLSFHLSDMFIKERATLFIYVFFTDEKRCHLR